MFGLGISKTDLETKIAVRRKRLSDVWEEDPSGVLQEIDPTGADHDDLEWLLNQISRNTPMTITAFTSKAAMSREQRLHFETLEQIRARLVLKRDAQSQFDRRTTTRRANAALLVSIVSIVIAALALLFGIGR